MGPSRPSEFTFHHYRNHDQTFSTTIPDAPPSPLLVTIETPSAQLAGNAAETRRCTVRGCTKSISADSGNKMCETCRGRHRTYAITKRARRKIEKAAVVSQNLGQLPGEQPAVWVAGNPPLNIVAVAVPPALSPSLNKEGRASGETLECPASMLAPYTPPSTSSWDRSLDPRLFASGSSELAGALVLPSLGPADSMASQHVPPTPTVLATPVVDIQAPSHEPEPVSLPGVTAATPPSGASPFEIGRFCSVKGCKALIPADYFFKMCEPCRGRYRGYGTTKRAKWKRDRLADHAELEALRQEEDQRRVAAGLPLLSEAPAEDWQAWESSIGNEQIQPSDCDGPPTRMCTVSHCHKILPGDYKYRRCEQHRLQNRYHSKLKRVREKESKSQVPPDELDQTEADGKTTEDKDRIVQLLFTHAPIEIDRGTQTDGDVNEPTGRPPAARGVRRTNHVCSIKGCCNLLAPQVPWKMCDPCRAHDRLVRKSRRLLQSRVTPNEGADTTDQTEAPSQAQVDTVPANTSDNPETASSSTAHEATVPTPVDPSTHVSPNSSNLDESVPSEVLSVESPPKSPSVTPSSIASNLLRRPTAPSSPILPSANPFHRLKKRKEKENTSRQTATSGPLVPLPYQPHYGPHQGQYQIPYYMLPPVNPPYSVPHVRQDPSGSHADVSQAYARHPPYPPQPYHPYQYPPYPHPPYAYAPYHFLPPPYNAPHTQPPYGGAPYPVHPYSHGAHHNGPTANPPVPPVVNGKKRSRNETVESAPPAHIDPHPAAVSSALPVASPAIPPPTSPTSETDTNPNKEASATRSCGNKACHRVIPTAVSGILCERCRSRVKKRQAKAKQRFRLEPRKAIVAGNRGKVIDSVDIPSN